MTGSRKPTLSPSNGDLLTDRTLLVTDLDGVVVLGADPVPHAIEALSAVRDRGLDVRFVTNNASRPPAAVAQTLRRIGVAAGPEEVVTSATGAARVLAGRFPPGSPVLVVGGEGVREALTVVGLRPVDTAAAEPVAVMQGFAPEVGWEMLAEAMVAIRAGAAWMATNLDRTLPSPRGPLPGNGSLVAALATASGATPESVGKPQPILYGDALADRSASAALAVGDRLDTDIEGARTAGIASLLVLTGVTGAAALVAAGPSARPDYVGRDLRALVLEHPALTWSGDAVGCRAARAELVGDVAEVSAGDPGPDGLDGLRALCELAWAEHTPDPRDHAEVYEAAIRELGLD